MRDFKLSICIPTYNRADLLKRALTRLLERMNEEGFSDEIQVCISNNASADHTEEVVRWFETQFKSVKYLKQPENMGFSRNLVSVIEMADGEFVLPAADDDLIKEGSLRAVFDALNLGYRIITFSSWIGGLNRKLLGDIPEGASIVIKNPVQATEYLGIFHFAAISNFVICKETYLKYHDPSFMLSAYPQTCVQLTALRHFEALFINLPIFKIDDSYRELNQGLLTSIDMSRVQAECVFSFGAPKSFINNVYMQLVRSIPRAIIKERKGLATRISGNPYADLSIPNMLDCYRYSVKYQFIGTLFWLVSKVMPIRFLERLLIAFRAG
jgi:glycosyltransferase involved in cell wall biosynthesis